MKGKLFLAGVSALALALAPLTAWPAEQANDAGAEENLEAVGSANPQGDEESTKGQERADEGASENAGKKAEGEEAAEEAAPE